MRLTKDDLLIELVMKIYVIFEKAYYTDGLGAIVKACKTKKLAIAVIRKAANVKYNRRDQIYEDASTQTLYSIEPVELLT